MLFLVWLALARDQSEQLLRSLPRRREVAGYKISDYYSAPLSSMGDNPNKPGRLVKFAETIKKLMNDQLPFKSEHVRSFDNACEADDLEFWEKKTNNDGSTLPRRRVNCPGNCGVIAAYLAGVLAEVINWVSSSAGMQAGMDKTGGHKWGRNQILSRHLANGLKQNKMIGLFDTGIVKDVNEEGMDRRRDAQSKAFQLAKTSLGEHIIDFFPEARPGSTSVSLEVFDQLEYIVNHFLCDLIERTPKVDYTKKKKVKKDAIMLTALVEMTKKLLTDVGMQGWMVEMTLNTGKKAVNAMMVTRGKPAKFTIEES